MVRPRPYNSGVSRMLPSVVGLPLLALVGLSAVACDSASRSEMLAVEELTEPIAGAGAGPESGVGAVPAAPAGGPGEMDAGVLGFFTPILAGPGMESYSTRCDPYDDDAFTCL